MESLRVTDLDLSKQRVLAEHAHGVMSRIFAEIEDLGLQNPYKLPTELRDRFMAVSTAWMREETIYMQMLEVDLTQP